MRSVGSLLPVPVLPPPTGRVVAPTRTWIEFDRPRPVYDWISNGEAIAGHEANGKALPWRVLETMGLPGGDQYVVVGETRYSDGRWFLEFAISGAWASAQRPPCEECGGTNGKHLKVDFEDERSGRTRQVRCPNAPMVRR